VTISALLQHAPAGDRRWSPRRTLCLGSTLQATGDVVTIHDLSSTGMLIETAASLAAFDGLAVDLPEIGIMPAIIVWNSGRFFGCEFNETLSQATISAALLRSRPANSAELMPSASPVPQQMISAAVEGPLSQTVGPGVIPEEEKAPLGVRLRVIFGSAIVLWVLFIWAIGSLIKLIRYGLG
jgi:hypothetical protein